MLFFIRISNGAKKNRKINMFGSQETYFFLNESGVFCFLLEGFSFYVK